MNKETAKDYLPLVKALADGKVIQVIAEDDTWEDLNSPAFTRPARCYRIKPEPKEIWLNQHVDGIIDSRAYPSKERAGNGIRDGWRPVRYVRADE